MQQLAVLEGRMTWLTYMVSAVIDAQTTHDPRKGQSELLWDGRLCRCVFQLVTIVDFRLHNTQGQGKCDTKLEIALLNFFRAFKKVHLHESSGWAGKSAVGTLSAFMGERAAQQEQMSMAGGVSHPLLSLVLNSRPPPKAEEEELSEINNVYDVMGIGDMIQVMNILVTKLCNNIKYWHRSDKILEETLDVFVELVSSYSSSKTLLGLDTVNFLVHNHVGAHFPFLGYDNDNKYRITFYSALSRLVFSSSEDLNNSFDAFLAPNLDIMAQLSQAPDLRAPAVKIAIVAALRDLRGITMSAYNKRTYNLLFDSLYPSSFGLLRSIADTCYDDPTVMTALLKFMQEFVANKGMRVFFENSSANGILLFRETSAIVCAYGSRILQVP
ncbi:hypothetical protein B484DRAFT_410640, partial [Ochromonadaceae sp. CCMP2298]